MKLTSLNITNFKIDGGAMFGVVPKVLWQKSYPADENNLCSWALRSLIVEDEGRVILIDNGFGSKQDEKFFSHFHLFGGEGLESGLNAKGYALEDITDVVLTHMHYDHCGGGISVNADTGVYEATFPSATIHVSRSHWNWAVNPNAREADSFLQENIFPMKELGIVSFVEGDTWLTKNVELRIFDGHTKGQVIPIIHHPKGTIVFAADLFPSTAHIPLPYIMSYDVEPMVTLKEKEDFLKESIDKGYTYFFQHDYFTECCSLIETPKGVRSNEKFTLETFLNK